MTSVFLATKNPGKFRLFSEAFKELGLKCEIASSGAQGMPVAETAKTPEGNALIKARAYWSPGRFVFGDDAGLEIDALNGEPGVQTRRWNGRFPDSISDEDWLNYLLERMQGVPLAERTARFVSGWALVGPDGQEGTKRIFTPFTIAEERIRPMTPGFPMSAVSLSLQSDDHIRGNELAVEFRRWPFFWSLISEYTSVITESVG